MNYDDLLVLLGALHRECVEYVLVGGVALNLHGFVRATEEVAFFVDPTDANVALLRNTLRPIDRADAAALADKFDLEA